MIQPPSLTDLTDPAQVADLNRYLSEIATELSRTAMPVEEVRSDNVTRDENRLRVVNSDAVPGSGEQGTQEVHFFIGNKWKRVKLEDL